MSVRKQLGLFVFGVVATVAIGLWVSRLWPLPPGEYVAVAVVEHADGSHRTYTPDTPTDGDTCEDTQRVAKAFFQVHPDVKTFGLACVRVVRIVSGGAK